MAVNGVAPPSAFAALLRHSKFASYDPLITQVYTTYGGDAHRGNFGLKRPLANRKRKPYIYLSAVDSPEQQTLWRTAEKRVKWLKKFEEAGCFPDVPVAGPMWQMVGHTGRTQWTLDSDFCIGTTEPKTAPSRGSMLNVAAMPPKRFEKYLNELRKLRPDFQRFIEENPEWKARNGLTQPDANSSTSLMEVSKSGSYIYKKFLGQYAQKRIDTPGSHYIEHQMHPNAGLSYTHTSPLQHFLLNKPLPGRIIDLVVPGRRDFGYLVSFAGMIAEMPVAESEGKKSIDWQTLVEQGTYDRLTISKFRMSGAKLVKAPQVVGKRRKDELELQTVVSSCEKPDMKRANLHLPWKREFVSHVTDVDTTAKDSRVSQLPLWKRSRPRKQIDLTLQSTAANSKLLGTLADMLNKNEH